MSSAYVVALRYLAKREYSVHELRQLLLSRGITEGEEALLRLQEEGLLSDARFAASRVRHRAMQGKGPQWIRQELREHQLDEQMIETALQASEVDWVRLADQERSKRFGEELPSEWQTLCKQKKFLQTRGFSLAQLNAIFSD